MALLDFIIFVLLPVSVLASTFFTLFLLTLPSRYNQASHASRGGSSAHSSKKDEGRLQCDANTIHIVVLGDIGRSPRMQYHAMSFARHGGQVNLIGFAESELHPGITSNPLISVLPLQPTPWFLQTSNKIFFLLTAPLKVLWQICSLYYALGYRMEAAKWMLVQNPPSIPTLVVAGVICFLRNTQLVIDWHNFGFSILAMKLGHSHPVVKLAKWYEIKLGKYAFANFSVTNAMAKVLSQTMMIQAVTLHDRPANNFRTFSKVQRELFLHRLPQTKDHAGDVIRKKCRLLVSSTSWTADEDFNVLLAALRMYSSRAAKSGFPQVLAIITGKGPQKQYYLNKIDAMYQVGALENVVIKTAWLSVEDYAGLLASADLGVSLHTSSSGVDLPMKVVDMFGAGLPVVGWSAFEAWPELVTEDVNGMGFESSTELTELLVKLFGGRSERLETLKRGAEEESARRWDDEWDEVAARVFGFGNLEEPMS